MQEGSDKRRIVIGASRLEQRCERISEGVVEFSALWELSLDAKGVLRTGAGKVEHLGAEKL